MFLRNQFKGDGVFEIPKIEKEEINLVDFVIAIKNIFRFTTW